MKSKARPYLLVIGIIFSFLAVFILVKMLRFMLFDQNTSSPPINQPASVAKPKNFPPILPVSQVAEDEPKQEPEAAQWMTFGGMDLLEEQVGFTFSILYSGNEQVHIPPVDILAWYPGVFEEGEFGIGKDLAVAWEHLGYTGLWIHSGWDFWQESSPATDLQYFLETNDLNEMQPLKSIEDKLNQRLRNSTVEVYNQGSSQQGLVTAAVRVPSGQVEELSRHTMDLVPYLASAYPESGFAEVGPDALLIYFCGRAALDEITDPDADYWTQTRFIIAIEPAP